MTGRDYPERIFVERDAETNGKRWFTVRGMGVEYARADALSAQATELVEARAENSKLRERIASEQAWTAAARMRTDEATRSRDEALAALKVAEEALRRVRAAILSDVNGLAIQCTVFMPSEGAPPHETLVDFIDAILGESHD